jgi:hypothetical protein
VNAAFPGTLGSNLSVLPEFGVFARVDFDVAVTAESSVGGKGSIRVWGLGAEGGKDSRSQTVSRECLLCRCDCLMATGQSKLLQMPLKQQGARSFVGWGVPKLWGDLARGLVRFPLWNDLLAHRGWERVRLQVQERGKSHRADNNFAFERSQRGHNHLAVGIELCLIV